MSCGRGRRLRRPLLKAASKQTTVSDKTGGTLLAFTDLGAGSVSLVRDNALAETTRLIGAVWWVDD
ncbi:hypothetical protein J6590_101057 [Homalodisca vitripennis]|nr:hypothetical protein J6590_101057 [Homalodisca vitripennis]